jgi:hypothetical protein
LQLHEKELVLFAVNDNPDVEWAAGGAHWWGTCWQQQQQRQQQLFSGLHSHSGSDMYPV